MRRRRRPRQRQPNSRHFSVSSRVRRWEPMRKDRSNFLSQVSSRLCFVLTKRLLMRSSSWSESPILQKVSTNDSILSKGISSSILYCRSDSLRCFIIISECGNYRQRLNMVSNNYSGPLIQLPDCIRDVVRIPALLLAMDWLPSTRTMKALTSMIVMKKVKILVRNK